jgi:hypothetical protein
VISRLRRWIALRICPDLRTERGVVEMLRRRIKAFEHERLGTLAKYPPALFAPVPYQPVDEVHAARVIGRPALGSVLTEDEIVQCAVELVRCRGSRSWLSPCCRVLMTEKWVGFHCPKCGADYWMKHLEGFVRVGPEEKP